MVPVEPPKQCYYVETRESLLSCSFLEILDCYDVLSSTASDIALREFLQQMKKSAPQVYRAS